MDKSKLDKKSFSEEEFGRKLDRCLTDFVVKGAGGLITGSVISLLFFRRRGWVVALGTGMGMGMAYRSCEHELNVQ